MTPVLLKAALYLLDPDDASLPHRMRSPSDGRLCAAQFGLGPWVGNRGHHRLARRGLLQPEAVSSDLADKGCCVLVVGVARDRPIANLFDGFIDHMEGNQEPFPRAHGVAKAVLDLDVEAR